MKGTFLCFNHHFTFNARFQWDGDYLQIGKIEICLIMYKVSRLNYILCVYGLHFVCLVKSLTKLHLILEDAIPSEMQEPMWLTQLKV